MEELPNASDIRFRFNEAIAGGANMDGDAGPLIRSEGHAFQLEQAITALTTTRAELAAKDAEIAMLKEHLHLTDANAAKAAGEYAEELAASAARVQALEGLLREIVPPKLIGESHDPYPEGKTTILMAWDWLKRARAALRAKDTTHD
jgi:hypothetical protein